MDKDFIKKAEELEEAAGTILAVSSSEKTKDDLTGKQKPKPRK